MSTGEISSGISEDLANGVWELIYVWQFFLEQIFLRIAVSLIYFLNIIYMNFSPINVMILFLKYIPTGIYMMRFTRNIYKTSRERINRKQSELEDIKLQIQIVNTKLSVRDAEFMEQAEQLQRGVDQLRRVRLRVRDLIAADETLRHMLDSGSLMGGDQSSQNYTSTPEQDHDFILELLTKLKHEQSGTTLLDKHQEKTVLGNHVPAETSTPENSVYSSLSDSEIKPDYQVKIVKVTNVYKVAYLKHYIKQKRLRRANKQAVLRKKMESIKNLLEDWQKSLNMVINNKLTVLNMDPQLDVTSQEAMGDYSKPFRDSSDSDSDFRNSSTDMNYDDYGRGWIQNPYRSYQYDFEECPEIDPSRDHYDPQDYGTKSCYNILQQTNECTNITGRLSTLLEETKSQVAIDQLMDREEDCPDLIVL